MYVIRFVRILHGFQQNLREVLTTTNKLNDYILAEIGIRIREQDTTRTEHSNRCNRFRRDVKQVLTPSELIHKFRCTDYEN